MVMRLRGMLITRRLSPPIAAWLLGLVYFVLAAITVAFTRFDGGAAFIWASSGLLLARLCQLPERRWIETLIPCALAIFLMAAIFGLGLAAAPMMTLANLIEPVIAALCLRYLVGAPFRMDTVRSITIFIAVAGLLAPALSGLAGTAIISYFAHGPLWLNWLHWFAAHALGAILFTPVAYVLMSGEALRWKRTAQPSDVISVLGLMALVAAVSALVFGQNRLPILFLPFLPMTFATIRGGRLGAMGSCVMLAIVGGICTAKGHGPVNLISASAGVRAIFLQAYIACAALLVLPIAALLKQRGELTRRLSESEARYRLIADSLGDAVVDVTADGNIRYASPAIANLTGLDPRDLIGKDVRSLVLDEDSSDVWHTHERALANPGGAFIMQYRGPRRDPAQWFEVSIRAVVTGSAEPVGVVGSIRDISNRKAAEERLDHAAHTDVLTGLANRRFFEEIMAKRLGEIGEGGPHASLAIFDLDHFKLVNDSHGHAAGDAVLTAVAAAASSQLRASDLIGRIGGEEFAVLFWGVDAPDAQAAAGRLQSAINGLRVAIDGPIGRGMHLTITASIGLAPLRQGETLADLMRRADAALYDAKRSGRDCLRIAA
jgi:diguanylate cyclase (GGDEF)-like protein/PAS domain S-box-containing protein